MDKKPEMGSHGDFLRDADAWYATLVGMIWEGVAFVTLLLMTAEGCAHPARTQVATTTVVGDPVPAIVPKSLDAAR